VLLALPLAVAAKKLGRSVLSSAPPRSYSFARARTFLPRGEKCDRVWRRRW
jgi:hypothetical protein